jgi:hypothetical protein
LIRLLVPVALAALAACGSSTPTPAQQADVGAYKLETDACIARAQERAEAGAISLAEAGEESAACRAKVRAAHGRADGGAP